MQAGALLKHERYPHKYPYDWRTKQPTIFRATDQVRTGSSQCSKCNASLQYRTVCTLNRPSHCGNAMQVFSTETSQTFLKTFLHHTDVNMVPMHAASHLQSHRSGQDRALTDQQCNASVSTATFQTFSTTVPHHTGVNMLPHAGSQLQSHRSGQDRLFRMQKHNASMQILHMFNNITTSHA